MLKAKSQWCKKALVASLLGSFLITSVGCNEDDFVAGVIIGGVVAGALIDDDHHSHKHKKHKRHRRKRERRSDHRRHRRDRFDTFQMNSTGGFTGLTLNDLNLQVNTPTETDRLNSFAKKYKIKPSSASFFIEAMDLAQQGDYSLVADLGLPLTEFQKISQLKMPSSVYIDSMAMNLGISAGVAQNILADLVDEAKIQFSDVKSSVWQECMSTGKWRTMENLLCTKESQTGCSPDTGASMCIPVL